MIQLHLTAAAEAAAGMRIHAWLMHRYPSAALERQVRWMMCRIL